MHGRCAVQVPVERVEALLLWEEPYASAKVFGAGLYVLICLRHLVCGARPSPAPFPSPEPYIFFSVLVRCVGQFPSRLQLHATLLVTRSWQQIPLHLYIYISISRPGYGLPGCNLHIVPGGRVRTSSAYTDVCRHTPCAAQAWKCCSRAARWPAERSSF